MSSYFPRKSFFPRSHISREVTFPGKSLFPESQVSHFPGSNISWEVKLPCKSHFPESHISQEVVFPGSHSSREVILLAMIEEKEKDQTEAGRKPTLFSSRRPDSS